MGATAHSAVAHRGADVVTVLTLFVVLLTFLPALLVVGPVGAFGTPANLLGLLCLGWWVLGRLLPDLGLPRSRQPVRVAVAGLAAALLLSYAHAMALPIDPLAKNGADRGLLALGTWAGIALLAADGVCCEARLRDLLRRLVQATSFVAVVGILQFFLHLDLTRYLVVPGLRLNQAPDFVQLRVLPRVAGTATHPIEFGVVLALVLPLALHLAMTDLGQPRVRRWAPVWLISLAVLLSISRSAILAVVVVCAVVLPTWPRAQRRAALLLTPVFLVVMRVAVPGLIGTIKNLFLLFGQDSSTTARTEDYAAVAPLIRHALLTGIGFRTYIPAVDGRVLDNQYLLSLVETGALGLLALVVLLLTGWFTARGARRAAVDPVSRSLGQALAAGMLAATAGFLTFDALSFPMFASLTFLLLGCSGALWRLQQPDVSPSCTPSPTTVDEPSAVALP